jgi:hypothetical protein
MTAKVAVPLGAVVLLAALVFYSVQRAAENPKAGPPCKVLVEVDLKAPIAQNKNGHLQLETLSAVLQDSIYRQQSLSTALEAIAYSENLEVSKHFLRGEAGEGMPGWITDSLLADAIPPSPPACDVRVYIFSTAEIGDEPFPPGRMEELRDCSSKGKLAEVKAGQLGKYGDEGTITPSEIARAARRWRMKHFWRYLL